MALLTQAKALKSLNLALKLDKHPEITARLFTFDGYKACADRGDIHPWLAFLLIADAYNDGGLKRDIAQAFDAFNRVANTLERKTPAAYRKLLMDKTRQEEGYSIDAFAHISPENARDHIKAVLKAERNPPAPPPKRKPLDTLDAYILPDGKLVHVGLQGHISYADSVGQRAAGPEELGWIKITSGAVWIQGKKPTSNQLGKLEEWCAFNGKDYSIIERDLVDKPDRDIRIFFNRT